MESPQERRLYPKSVRRRRTIVNAAIPLLAASGYRGLSMRQVAERAGLTQSGLLHQFSSKDELVRAVLDERTRRSGAGIAQMRDFEPTRIMIRNAAEHPELTRLYFAMVGEASDIGHPLHDYFVNDFHWKRRVFAFGFSLAKTFGDVRADIDSRELAELLITLMDGLQTQWLYEKEIDLVVSYDRQLLRVAPVFGASMRVVQKLEQYNAEHDARMRSR
ncbi:TetR/AcrR family transcriptional regulator [Microbacterium tumbae]